MFVWSCNAILDPGLGNLSAVRDGCLYYALSLLTSSLSGTSRGLSWHEMNIYSAIDIQTLVSNDCLLMVGWGIMIWKGLVLLCITSKCYIWQGGVFDVLIARADVEQIINSVSQLVCKYDRHQISWGRLQVQWNRFLNYFSEAILLSLQSHHAYALFRWSILASFLGYQAQVSKRPRIHAFCCDFWHMATVLYLCVDNCQKLYFLLRVHNDIPCLWIL